MEISRLKEYFDDLPTLDNTSNKPRPTTKTSSGALNLDEDIILEIFLYLTSEDIENARIAGATDVEFPNIFCRRKIRLDFPWLWDLPNCNVECDWLRVYNTILRFSQVKADDMIFGLANRRCICNVCSQLVDLYLENIRLSPTEDFTGDDAEDII